jgi:hypothetical protein
MKNSDVSSMNMTISEVNDEIKSQTKIGNTEQASFLAGVRYARIYLAGAIPAVCAAGVAL